MRALCLINLALAIANAALVVILWEQGGVWLNAIAAGFCAILAIKFAEEADWL